MRVFLGNIPWYNEECYGVRAGSRWPHFQPKIEGQKIPPYMPFPFFLSYAASLLEKEIGLEVLLVDGIAEGISREEFQDRIKGFAPDIIVFETSTPSINYDLNYVKDFKRSYGQECKFVFSGPHSEMFKKEFLKENNDIDFILVGEYELSLKELCLALKDNKDISDVLGIIYRDKQGKVVVNASRPLIEHVDDLPYPARHFLPMHNYQDLVCGLPGPSLQMWASRGCPYGCIFCFWPQVMYHGRNYRPRDPKKIVDELETVLKEYKFKSFYFDDDTFNIGKDRIIKLCEEIKQRKINLPWAIMARADIMDSDILKALKEAGLYALKYGMESVVQEIVDKSGKNLDLEKAKAIVDETRRLGIKVHLTFSFGLPGETIDTIDQTIRRIVEVNPDNVQFSIITPFPGSEYFEILKEKDLILSYNWDDYNGSVKAVFKTENLTVDDLDDALERAKNVWVKRYHTNANLQKEFFSKFEEGLDTAITEKESVKKIVVFRSSFVEHAQDVLAGLKNKFRDAEINLIVQEEFLQLFKSDNVNTIAYTGKIFNDDQPSVDFIKNLTDTPYDLGVILYNNPDRYGYNHLEKLASHVKVRKFIGAFVEGDVEEIG